MTGGSESLLSWVFKLVNFAILAGILVKFLGKPIKTFFANRHKTFKDKLDEAEKKLLEAQALKKEYESKLSNLDAEIEAFKKAVLEDAEKEKQKIINEATDFAARLKEQTKFTYQQELREVMGKIKEEIAKLTIERAEKLVAERLTEEDHARMVEVFIEKMRSLN